MRRDLAMTERDQAVQDEAAKRTADGRLPSLATIQEVFARATSNRLYGGKFKDLSLGSWDDFFARADRCLYLAKESGRDRVGWNGEVV